MTYFPHLVCLRGDTALIWSSVATDSLIALAYYAIPMTIYSLRKAKRLSLDPELESIWSALQLFILACGTGHAVDVANLWMGLYWLKIGVNVLTVLSSITAAVVICHHGVRYGKLMLSRREIVESLTRMHEKLRELPECPQELA